MITEGENDMYRSVVTIIPRVRCNEPTNNPENRACQKDRSASKPDKYIGAQTNIGLDCQIETSLFIGNTYSYGLPIMFRCNFKT